MEVVFKFRSIKNFIYVLIIHSFDVSVLAAFATFVSSIRKTIHTKTFIYY